MRRAEPFELVWPDLSRRLSSRLRTRSISPSLADDVVQETGLQLFRMWDQVDADRSIWGLTVTIANQVLWRQAKEQSRSTPVETIPDRAGTSDTEGETLARLELQRVRRAMARLSPSYRSVLIAEVDGSVALARSEGAVKVMRLRARRKLGGLLEQVHGIIVGSGLPNLVARLQTIKRGLSPRSEMTAPAMAAVITAVFTALAPGPGPGPGRILQPGATDPQIDVSREKAAETGLFGSARLNEPSNALRPTLRIPKPGTELKRSSEELERSVPETDVIVDAGPIYVAKEYPKDGKGEPAEGDPAEDIVSPITCPLGVDASGDCEEESRARRTLSDLDD